MTLLARIASKTVRLAVRIVGLKDATPAILAWAKWGRDNHAEFFYSMNSDRMDWLKRPRGALPVHTDCSGSTRLWFWLGGAQDVMKLGYNVLEGYTGTELSADQHIAMLIRGARGVWVRNIRPTDLCVYGGGTGKHVAMVMVAGSDPLMISMGRQGDPSLVAHSKLLSLGPPTWLRCSTLTRRVYFPPTNSPTTQQLSGRRLVAISGPNARLARTNGWPLFMWNGYDFMEVVTGIPAGVVYANRSFATKKP